MLTTNAAFWHRHLACSAAAAPCTKTWTRSISAAVSWCWLPPSTAASQLEWGGGMIPANTPVIHTTVGRYSAVLFYFFQRQISQGNTIFHPCVLSLGWNEGLFLSLLPGVQSLPLASITYILLLTRQTEKKIIETEKENIAALAFPRYALAGIMLSASLPQSDVDSPSGPRTPVSLRRLVAPLVQPSPPLPRLPWLHSL